MPQPETSFPATSSVKTLLNGLLDLSGLGVNSPTRVEKAVKTYQAHRQGGDDWMLGSFLVGSEHVEAIRKAAQHLSEDAPLPLRVFLGRFPHQDPPAMFEQTIAAVQEALLELGRTATLTGWAWSLPADALTDPAVAVATMSRAGALLDSSAFAACPRYVEIDLDGLTSREVSLYFLAMGAQSSPELLRAAVRMENVHGNAGIEAMAAFLNAAVRTGRPFALCGNLDHAVRTMGRIRECERPGLLNVLFATVLAQSQGLDATGIAGILAESDPSAFVFTKGGIVWNGLEASNTAVIAARRQLMQSASCFSFDAPRTELRGLGWLTR